MTLCQGLGAKVCRWAGKQTRTAENPASRSLSRRNFKPRHYPVLAAPRPDRSAMARSSPDTMA